MKQEPNTLYISISLSSIKYGVSLSFNRCLICLGLLYSLAIKAEESTLRQATASYRSSQNICNTNHTKITASFQNHVPYSKIRGDTR